MLSLSHLWSCLSCPPVSEPVVVLMLRLRRTSPELLSLLGGRAMLTVLVQPPLLAEVYPQCHFLVFLCSQPLSYCLLRPLCLGVQ